MSQNRVDCYCQQCNLLICSCRNEWIQISNTYSTYESSEAYTQPGLTVSGEIRQGAINSGLEGCSVQPLRCDVCKTTLGVKCVRAPEEKTEYKYVLISRFHSLPVCVYGIGVLFCFEGLYSAWYDANTGVINNYFWRETICFDLQLTPLIRCFDILETSIVFSNGVCSSHFRRLISHLPLEAVAFSN